MAGIYAPPFRDAFSPDDYRAMIEAINAAAQDVLWVGLSAPKQEKWLHQHRDVLKVRFAGAIGAVFDFYSGEVQRSPRVFQQLGLK